MHPLEEVNHQKQATMKYNEIEEEKFRRGYVQEERFSKKYYPTLSKSEHF